MSVATMNWALRQRLASPQQQILLYVISDSADPDGVTRFCTPDYMEQHARMTRATMFRRLGELEDLGLLKRLKFYSERGAPIYEIRLALGVLVDLPIYRRGKNEDSDDENETSAEPVAEAETAIPKSQPETLVETTKVPCSASPESHSCDSICPSTSEESPPYPPPGGLLSKSEREATDKRDALWARFVQGYPNITTMDQQAARDELDELSLDDAEWAVSVLSALKEELRKAKDRPPKNAHIWLRKGMFRNFPRGRLDAPAPAPEAVWIIEGSDEDRALRFVRSLAKAVNPMVRDRGDGTRGYPHKSAVGLDLLAMLAFVNDVVPRWRLRERGSENCGAWQERFREWIDRPLPVDGNGIRTPGPWPPSKDGKIYRDEDSDALVNEGER